MSDYAPLILVLGVPALIVAVLAAAMWRKPCRYLLFSVCVTAMTSVAIVPFLVDAAMRNGLGLLGIMCGAASAGGLTLSAAAANGRNMQSFERAMYCSVAESAADGVAKPPEVPTRFGGRRVKGGWTRQVVPKGAVEAAMMATVGPDLSSELLAAVCGIGAIATVFAAAPLWIEASLTLVCVAAVALPLSRRIVFAGSLRSGPGAALHQTVDPWKPTIGETSPQPDVRFQYALGRYVASGIAEVGQDRLMVLLSQKGIAADGVPVLSRQQWNRLRWFGLLPAGVRRRTADLGRTA